MHLGRVDVDRMLSEITSAQFAEIMAFFRLEPWGTHEDDRRTATIAATIANAAPGKKRKAWGADDFMPKREAANQDWRAQRQMFKALTGS